MCGEPSVIHSVDGMPEPNAKGGYSCLSHCHGGRSEPARISTDLPGCKSPPGHSRTLAPLLPLHRDPVALMAIPTAPFW
jgi:hypothetical protein